MPARIRKPEANPMSRTTTPGRTGRSRGGASLADVWAAEATDGGAGVSASRWTSGSCRGTGATFGVVVMRRTLGVPGRDRITPGRWAAHPLRGTRVGGGPAVLRAPLLSRLPGDDMALNEYRTGAAFPGVIGRTTDESSPAWPQ